MKTTKPLLTQEQIAECFELRNKGVYWANMEIIYGRYREYIQKCMLGASFFGLDFWKPEIYCGFNGYVNELGKIHSQYEDAGLP